MYIKLFNLLFTNNDIEWIIIWVVDISIYARLHLLL